MEKTKITKFFTIIFTSVFTGSFFVLRAILDVVDWSNLQSLILASVFSGIVAVVITPLLTDTNNRKWGILLTSLYFIFLVVVLLFSKIDNLSKTGLSLEGVWETKESDGENFKLDFFKQDSLRLIMPPDQERVVSYKWKGGDLQIYDEEGILLFNWNIKIDTNKFMILQGDDRLIFYKKY